MNPSDRYLILGIGGSGMASLAHTLLDYGCNLIGYDKSANNQTSLLRNRGVDIFLSYEEFMEHSDSPILDGVIYSSAIRISPFLDWATTKGIRRIHRSEAMHELFGKKLSISIAGSHGKTSTTGMVSQILSEVGMDPSIMIGGDSPILVDRGGKWGGGKYSVYESDESDGTFLNHCANYRILTNVDEDHLDHYKTRENLWKAFRGYIDPLQNPRLEDSSIPIGSLVIVYADDPAIREILSGIPDKKNIIAVGRDLNPQEYRTVYTLDISSGASYLASTNGTVIEFQIPYLGDHYRKNASLAIALAIELKIPMESVLKSLASYKGVSRRMEILHNNGGILILDDYGHHPTEIIAVISAIQNAKKENRFRRTIVIFQPHRFTRTQALFKEFARSLEGLDKLYLLPIYSAGEDPIPGVNTQLIADELLIKGEDVGILTGDRILDCNSILPELQGGDILLCLGAGDVWKWGQTLSQLLNE